MPGYASSKLAIIPSTAAGSMSPLAILILVLAEICSIDLVSEGSIVITTGATTFSNAVDVSLGSPLASVGVVKSVVDVSLGSPLASVGVVKSVVDVSLGSPLALDASLALASSSACPSPLPLPTVGKVIIATPFLL